MPFKNDQFSLRFRFQALIRNACELHFTPQTRDGRWSIHFEIQPKWKQTNPIYKRLLHSIKHSFELGSNNKSHSLIKRILAAFLPFRSAFIEKVSWRYFTFLHSMYARFHIEQVNSVLWTPKSLLIENWCIRIFGWNRRIFGIGFSSCSNSKTNTFIELI